MNGRSRNTTTALLQANFDSISGFPKPCLEKVIETRTGSVHILCFSSVIQVPQESFFVSRSTLAAQLFSVHLVKRVQRKRDKINVKYKRLRGRLVLIRIILQLVSVPRMFTPFCKFNMQFSQPSLDYFDCALTYIFRPEQLSNT